MTDIGELVVRIKADAAQMQSEMRNATNTVKQSSNEMASALGSVKGMLGELGIALSVGAFVEFTKGALDAADNLYIMSQRTGIAASTLSALNIPLKQNGSSVDEFASSMKFLSRNIELASEGNKMLITRFDDLGLSVTKLKALSPEQQFYAVAAALAPITDQSRFAADGLTLMGRGAAGLFPIIKETNGKLAEFVQTQKELGNALTDEEIKKVHEYEDAWISFTEHLKITIVDATTALVDFLDEAQKFAGFDPDGAMSILRRKKASELAGQDVDPEFQKRFGLGAAPSRVASASQDIGAKGSNSDLSGPAKFQTNEVQTYIANLKGEAEALSKSKLELEEYNAVKEASAKAITDFNNNLRASKDLTDDEKATIEARVAGLEQAKQAQEELNKQQQKQIAMAAQMDAQIASSLANIVVNYKNAGNAIKGVLDEIAKKILEENVTSPLVNMLSGAFKSQGGFGGLWNSITGGGDSGVSFDDVGNPVDSLTYDPIAGYASGGNPPVGVPSMVGENGPELFVPNQSGTIIPNNKLGGQSVIVQQTINLSPGLEETVNAAILNAAPAIAGMAHAGVMQAIQKGGADSRVVGKRAN
jgi:hypothetical protein